MQLDDNVSVSNMHPLGMLHKKLKILKPYTIFCIRLVPEYTNAIQNYNGEYTDISIYEVIRDTYIQMLLSGAGNSTASRALTLTSENLFGDKNFWKKNIDVSNIFFAKNLQIIDDITVLRINNVSEFVVALKNYPSLHTDESVYKVLCSICVPRWLNGDIGQNELSIISSVSFKLTGSPVSWKKYNEQAVN